MLSWLELLIKPLFLHLVGCLYYLYQWCTVKQISDNEIYLLIKYIKSVLWRVAKCVSYVEEARCLKVKHELHTVTAAGLCSVTLNPLQVTTPLPFFVCLLCEECSIYSFFYLQNLLEQNKCFSFRKWVKCQAMRLWTLFNPLPRKVQWNQKRVKKIPIYTDLLTPWSRVLLEKLTSKLCS